MFVVIVGILPPPIYWFGRVLVALDYRDIHIVQEYLLPPPMDWQVMEEKNTE